MKTSPLLSSLLLPLVCLAVLATGCDTAGVEGQNGGAIRVLMTDAPIDGATAVDVTIDRVELVGTDGNVVVLTDEDTPVNLLALRDGVTTTLAQAEIPAGDYAQLRIVVQRDAAIVFDDGTSAELKIPSGEQTGIKVKGLPAFQVGDGAEQVGVLVDFDALQSIHRAGNSGQYILRPVIKLEEMEIDDEDVDFEEEDQVTGAVESVDATSFTVAGRRFVVDEGTVFKGVTDLAALTVGTQVEVEYAEQADGTLLAVEVELDDGEDPLHAS